MINIRFNVSKRYFYNSKEIPKYIVNIIFNIYLLEKAT
jgi:hypothetical protein